MKKMYNTKHGIYGRATVVTFLLRSDSWVIINKEAKQSNCRTTKENNMKDKYF